MASKSIQLNFVQRWSTALVSLLVLLPLAVPSNAQTQASCQFTTFNTRFFLNTGGTLVLFPQGVNDYGTVVGEADNNVDF